jgi:hypothetical protein
MCKNVHLFIKMSSLGIKFTFIFEGLFELSALKYWRFSLAVGIRVTCS